MSATLTVLGSSSRGNGYLLDANGEQLIIECGVPFKECAKALGHDISHVRAVICSHQHTDHAKYISQYKAHGLRVYCTPEHAPTADCYYMMLGLRYVFGRFKVTPVEVPHGECQTYAYIIDHAAFGRLAFITDAEKFPYKLQGVNTLMIEANYSDDIRVDAMLNGAELRAQSRNHMELGETIRTINRLKSSELQSVALLHLSDALSDSEGFKRAIREQCGVNAEVAEKNKIFILQKEEF